MQAIKFVSYVLFVIVAVLAQSSFMSSNAAASSPNSANLPEGIAFNGAYTQSDVEYLQDTLAFLQTHLPTWYQYVVDAKPLVLNVDLGEGAHGRAAIAKCCDAQGRGVITFGFYLGQSPDDAGQTVEAKRVAFIGTLVHEVTHVRDQRAGRFTTKTDFKSCVAAEKSGLEKQLDVKRALASVKLSDGYVETLNRQIGAEEKAIRSRELWNQYCGVFE